VETNNVLEVPFGNASHLVMVAREIFRAGATGVTDEEVETRLDMRHQTASARRRDLVIAGLVKKSKLRRETRSGSTATVWVWAMEAWVSPERIAELVRISHATKRKNKRARGGRHPLDMWGMVRVARESFGALPPEEFTWPERDYSMELLRRLEEQLTTLREASGMRDREDFEEAISLLLYSTLSVAWKHGVNLPESFQSVHKKFMAQAAQRKKEQEGNLVPQRHPNDQMRFS